MIIDLTQAEAQAVRHLLASIGYQLDAVEAHNLAYGVVLKIDAAAARQSAEDRTPATVVNNVGPSSGP